MKLITLVVVILIGGSFLGWYLMSIRPKGDQVNQVTTPSPSVSPLIVINPSPATVSSEVPPDWKLYTSPNGFKLYYPPDMENDSMSEGERFYKLGPTQSRGTELYDGISLLLRTGDMADLTLEKLVQQKHQEMKNAETTQEITDPVTKTYGNHQAIQFRQSSLGDGDFIYIKMPGKKYLEIINLTVEPQNREQTYQKVVYQMIKSISF